MSETENQTLQVRPCRSEDFDEVLALLCQLWPDKPIDPAATRAVYERALANPSQTYLCACTNERVVGLGSLTVKNNLWQEGYLGFIEELVVDSPYRGCGIGTQLLDHLVALAGDKGCRRVELDSAFHRQEAHRFYERYGFRSRAYLFSKPL